MVAVTIAEGETIESFKIGLRFIQNQEVVVSPVYRNTALAKDLQASAVPSTRLILPGGLETYVTGY